MSWSASAQRIALKLQQIERARKFAAEARVADARDEADGARRGRDDAARSLEAAEQGWAGHLASGRIDLELGKSIAAQLMREDSALMLRERGLEAAASELEAELQTWRLTEAKVRSGERALSKGRRRLAKRAQGKIDQNLAERTTWAWFRK